MARRALCSAGKGVAYDGLCLNFLSAVATVVSWRRVTCVFPTNEELDMSLKDAGWARYAPETDPDNLTGRVALVHRDRFVVWTDDGETTATASGHLRHSAGEQPCIGDWVTLRDGCVISAVLPRRTKLSRKEPGRRGCEQVLAANIDVLFVVSGSGWGLQPAAAGAVSGACA